MELTRDQRKAVQRGLNEKGFGPLTVDGVFGRETNAALVAFKRSVGYRPRPYVGELTFAALTGGKVPDRKPAMTRTGIPWVDEALGVLGLHETRDWSTLSAFLKSDGSSVGDPSKVPWCGDLVETAIRRTLPGVRVPANPYLAANWNDWGLSCGPCVGAIVVFWRGSPSSWKGHIGFIVGESADNWYVLGGNQRNAVTVTPISKDRVRRNGIRWPSGTSLKPGGRPPAMSGGTVTTNEH